MGYYKVLLSAYNIWAHVELFCLFSSDRLQTSVNVMGDTYAAAFVEKMSQKELNNNGDEDLEMNGDKPTSTDGFTPSLSLLEDEKDEHGDLNTTLWIDYLKCLLYFVPTTISFAEITQKRSLKCLWNEIFGSFFI